MADDSTTDATQTQSNDISSLALKAMQDLVVAINNLAQTVATAPT